VIGLCCSVTWTTFGFYIDNWNVVIPNLLGIAFSVVTIIVWVYFYNYNKVSPKLDTLVDDTDRERDVDAPPKY
jgi:hypothetical protein